MSRLAIAALIAASAAGCVAKRSLGDNQPCPCAPGWMCDVSQNVCVPESISGGDGGSLPMVAPGCGATCSTPAGTVQPLDDIASLATALIGRWRICRNWPGGFAPSDVIGIEFDPGTMETWDGGPDPYTVVGNAYYLVNGPSGPARGQGFDYQLDYQIWPPTDLAIHNGGGGLGGQVRYSPCPLELEINLFSPGAILVPFGG